MATPFPFAAIVGQDEMKLALLAAAVDPTLGGVLVLGDRGTGKSTAVRALAALLPPMRVVEGCRYGCDPQARGGLLCPECTASQGLGRLKTKLAPVPVVDLPLGATEDRVLGALDLERALSQGIKAFEPGLLARAHRGFLYIDEVNLLEDHLVDLLIDVAASGENVVEREPTPPRRSTARVKSCAAARPTSATPRPSPSAGSASNRNCADRCWLRAPGWPSSRCPIRCWSSVPACACNWAPTVCAVNSR